MERDAQLSGNTIVNVIESETDPDGINGNWIACGNAGPGWTYDGSTFNSPAPEPEVRHITVGSFFDRFGDQKWPILADANASVQALIKDASVRSYINLDDPQVLTGLQMVQSAGHNIDPTAIITAPIQPEERP
jgi:hypothetical protein